MFVKACCTVRTVTMGFEGLCRILRHVGLHFILLKLTVKISILLFDIYYFLLVSAHTRHALKHLWGNSNIDRDKVLPYYCHFHPHLWR